MRELIARIYETYNNRDDVKAALSEYDANSERIGEIGEVVWSDDHGLNEDELAELQAEMDGLSQHNNELDKFRIPMVMEQDLTQEGTAFNPSVSYFIGADDIPFAEAVVSEAAIGAQAYSLVLLRMEEGADVESAKAKIREGADPMKWICAGVDPSDVIVDNIGDLVILIMFDNSKALHEAFLELAK